MYLYNGEYRYSIICYLMYNVIKYFNNTKNSVMTYDTVICNTNIYQPKN